VEGKLKEHETYTKAQVTEVIPKKIEDLKKSSEKSLED